MEISQTQEFSTFDVMKILGIKRERLREWANQGFIQPTSPAEGQGTKAVFTILDIYKIAVFKRLVEAGINRRIASIMVQTNPKLNSITEVNEINYILYLERDDNIIWINYFETEPFTLGSDIFEDPSWDVGIMINFKKLKEIVMKSVKF